MKVTRRDLLHIVISGAVSMVIFAFFKVTGARALPRPPGSLIEGEFLKFCTRCYQCIDICPADALQPASIVDGISNLGTPVLDVKKCIFCQECMRVCPTGAIQKIPKDEIDIGNATIDHDICLSWTKKRRCMICYKACPYDAIKLEKRRFPIVIENKCTGCGVCERRCPTTPKSIVVDYEKYRRLARSEKRLALKIEDRTGEYQFPPSDFRIWFVQRVEKLAKHYGLMK